MPFEYPIWGVVEGVTEPASSDWWCWFRGASCYFGRGALVLVLSRRLVRRGLGFLGGDALGLAFLPRDHMNSAILRILVVVNELDAGRGVIDLGRCWRVPKL